MGEITRIRLGSIFLKYTISDDGGIHPTTMNVHHGLFYFFGIPFAYLNNCINEINHNNSVLKKEPLCIQMLNNIENQEIKDDLQKLLLDKKYYHETCELISKYNKPEYRSNTYINGIVFFAIQKKELGRKNLTYVYM